MQDCGSCRLTCVIDKIVLDTLTKNNYYLIHKGKMSMRNFYTDSLKRDVWRSVVALKKGMRHEIFTLVRLAFGEKTR